MFQKICLRPNPGMMNVTLFGKRVFADVIRGSWVHLDSPVHPNPMTSAFIRDRREDTGRIGEGHAKTKAEMPVMQLQPRNAWCHQKLEKARKESSPQLLEAAWPCPQLNLRLPPSRRDRIHIYYIKPPCLWLFVMQPRKLIQGWGRHLATVWGPETDLGLCLRHLSVLCPAQGEHS